MINDTAVYIKETLVNHLYDQALAYIHTLSALQIAVVAIALVVIIFLVIKLFEFGIKAVLYGLAIGAICFLIRAMLTAGIFK